MSAVCPACGVAVVPGYVRCPRCHSALPIAASRRNTSTIDPGGTSVSHSSVPRMALWGLGIVGGIFVLWIVIGWIKDAFTDYRTKIAGDASIAQPETPAAPGTRGTAPITRPTPDQTSGSQDQTLTPAPPPRASGPSATASAADLERTLRRRRLWATVEVVGARVDVRSGSCGDVNMSPLIETARGPLHSAGLTRLRCLEQSGRVVFERDL